MRVRARVLVCLGGSLAMVASLLASPGAEASSLSTNASWASMFAAVPVGGAGAPVASGTLSVHGQPSANATVVLWTNIAAATQPVAVARTGTGSTGQWAVSIPPSIDLTPYTDTRSGMINFFVQSFDGVGSASYFLSAKTVRTLAAEHQLSGLIRSGTASVGGVAVNLLTDPAVARGINLKSEQSPLQRRIGHGPVPLSCTFTTLATYTGVKTWLGYTSNDASDTSEQFSYSSGSSSSLGVGLQGSSGWSANGTQSKSSTVSATFAAVKGRAYRNYYGTTNYVKVREKCGGKAFSNTVTLDPSALTGGFSSSVASAIGMNYCVPEPAVFTVTKDTTAEYNNTAGVSTSDIIGISLSAQTGYSSKASISYTWTTHGRPWCGNRNYPGLASQLQTIHVS